MESQNHGCPNCGAPLDLEIGDVEVVCDYCVSRLKFIPGDNELEVVKTREEMKRRERVAVEKEILRKKFEQEEMDRWRQTAAKVAIAAVPIVGRTAGRAAFNAAAGRGIGCGGCGCLALIAAILAGGAVVGL